MKKKIKPLIKEVSGDIEYLDRFFITKFVNTNNIKVSNNSTIKSVLLTEHDQKKYDLELSLSSFSFEDLIEIFEITIPNTEKRINGAVYTPKIVKDFIIEECLKSTPKSPNDILCADLSCGCGAFLYSVVSKIYNNTNTSITDIVSKQIYGVDISKLSIQRSKIILSLFALINGEDSDNIDFNLFEANSLSFDWDQIEYVKNNNGFDLIVGNPPYVRAKNISAESKKLLSNWAVATSGNTDLYIPFFEIGYENLNNSGILGYITVNSFYKSLNARSLRNYFHTNKAGLKIIDFGDSKVFSDKLAYTCICFIDKNYKDKVLFTKSTLDSLEDIKSSNFNEIEYSRLNPKKGWLLHDRKTLKNIRKIENVGRSLGELYKIKNGIATLSNKTYIFTPSKEDENNYYFEQNEETYKVEKSICRDIIKPNILKTESQLSEKKEKLIYPYKNGTSKLSLIKEEELKKEFPNAYNYLSDYKEKLNKRDKGRANYEEWYAYGRTQALSDYGLKLLFPYMAKKPYFVFTAQKDLLIYCGYAIFSESKNDLLILKKLLESIVFEYYMTNTSKPYTSGYFSFAKNYVKNFGVIEFSDNEKKFIKNCTDKSTLDNFFIDKYKIEI